MNESLLKRKKPVAENPPKFLMSEQDRYDEEEREYADYLAAEEASWEMDNSDPEGTDKRLLGVLEDVLRQYDVNDRGSDFPLYGTISAIDDILFPNAMPENTGILEKGSQERIEPLLVVLAQQYPHAVKRFKSVFFEETKPEEKPQSEFTYDPDQLYGSSEKQEEILAHYSELLKSDTDTVVRFAVRAINNGTNAKVGNELIERALQTNSWEDISGHFFDDSGESFVPALLESILKISDLQSLPNTTLEEFRDRTRNDLEWIAVEAVLKNRKGAEDTSLLSQEECVELLWRNGVSFCDNERINSLAQVLIREQEGTYDSLMWEIEEKLRAQWTDYEGGPLDTAATAYLNDLLNMSDEELLSEIDPIYAFNTVLRSYPDEGLMYEGSAKPKDEMIGTLFLSDEEIRSRTAELIQDNKGHSFFNAMAFIEGHQKWPHLAVKQMTRINFADSLRNFARKEGKERSEVEGYITTSSAVHLGNNALALYNPTGRLIEIVKINNELEEKHDSIELAEMYNLNYIISDTTSYSRNENALATVIASWERFPSNITEQLTKCFSEKGLDIQDHRPASKVTFQSIVELIREEAKLLPISLTSSIEQFITGKIDEIEKNLAYAESLDINELSIMMEQRYPGRVDEKELSEMINSFNFETVRYLEESLGIDFGTISTNEVFGLIYYLKTKSGGQGYENIKNFTVGCEEDDRRNRIKSFLSVEQGNDEGMGEKIIAIGEKYSTEEANAIFEKYSEIVDQVDEVESYLKKEFKGATPEMIYKISNNLLVKGKKILERFARKDSQGDDLLGSLSKIKSDNLVLAEKYKVLRDQGVVISLDQLSDIQLETVNASDLSDDSELRKQLEDIYRSNLKNMPELYSDFRLERFATNQSKEGFSVRILKNGEKVMSFLVTIESLNEEKQNIVEVSGFNANSEFGDSTGAMSILEGVLEEYENKGFIIKADATCRNARVYIQNKGFIAYGSEVYGDTEIMLIKKNPHQVLETQNKEVYTRGEIKRMADLEMENGGERVVYHTTKNQDAVPEHIQRGYWITQSFVEGNDVYYLLERNSE